MSSNPTLTGSLFSEAECPPKGRKIRPPRGVGLRALQVLYDEFPNPRRPKDLAREARTPYEGTKKWLTRNKGVWVMESPSSGWYRARATLALLRRIGLEPPRVHALQLLCKSPDGGTPPQLQGLGHKRVLRDGTVQREADWNGRKVTVQAGPDGALVSIRASTDPIPVPLFSELAAYLHGLCTPGTVVVKGFDLGIDTANHRLAAAGVEAVTLYGFQGDLLKVYNKRCIQATRLEACFHRIDLPMSEVARVLNELATPTYDPTFPPPHGPEVA
jgi:hypothetical protein